VASQEAVVQRGDKSIFGTLKQQLLAGKLDRLGGLPHLRLDTAIHAGRRQPPMEIKVSGALAEVPALATQRTPMSE